MGLLLVESSPQGFTLRAGTTLLTFEQAQTSEPLLYHFAFNVPERQFAEATDWLRARVPLIADAEGDTVFFFDGWNADACYFYDAAGNIGEFIARHTLVDDADTPFSRESIRGVSEIGIVVDDVQAAVEALHDELALPIYDGEGSEAFSVLGDDQGLLIVVKSGRKWLPTADRYAYFCPVHVTITGNAPRQMNLMPQGYEIVVTPNDSH
jgi:catechol-2,3-dioxygenase